MAYGDEAQAGVVAVLGAADEVAAERGEGGEGCGPFVRGQVAVGDLGGGEGEDALDDGEVALLGEVGAGGLQVGGGGEVAVADHVAQGVPQDGAGEGVGDVGDAAQGGLGGHLVEADLGVGEVEVVGDDEGGAGAGAGFGGGLLRDVRLVAFAQEECAAVVEVAVVDADGDAVGAAARAVEGEGPLPGWAVTDAVRVSTPVVRSQESAQAWTSRSVAAARDSMKSARVALENLWRAKWVLMPARKSFSPSQATSWRSAEAPLA